MTQTLTTDRLKQITDAISAEPHDYESIYDSIKHGEIAAMARELLANREAQPVGYIAEVSGNRVGVLRGLPLPDVGSLIYTAPPAPVVNTEFTGATAVSDDSDPRDEFESVFPMPKYVVRCGAGYAVTAYSAWGAHDFNERWVGWNACRAAMLAQPVSQVKNGN